MKAGIAIACVMALACFAAILLLWQRPSSAPQNQVVPTVPPALELAADDADSALLEAFAVDPAHALAEHPNADVPPRIWRDIPPESAADLARPAPGDLRDGVRIVDFAALSDYPLHLPPVGAPAARASAYLNEQIPSRIKRLNGQTIRLEGFLFPIAITAGKATTYLLMADYLQCCFADLSSPNAWAVVSDASGIAVELATPVIVTGKLEVGGAELAAAGVSSLYRITATKSRIAPPPPVESPLPKAF